MVHTCYKEEHPPSPSPTALDEPSHSDSCAGAQLGHCLGVALVGLSAPMAEEDARAGDPIPVDLPNSGFRVLSVLNKYPMGRGGKGADASEWEG